MQQQSSGIPKDWQAGIDVDAVQPEDESEDYRDMIGTCEAMLQVFHLIRKVGATDIPVLVTGPSGTGKEMVARTLHQQSLRNNGPFVAVNCGAIPHELLESELFGHEKGAFTGAHATAIGKVEQAQGGTLFLDEVGELPLLLQVKLLRFLQEYSFERVGGRKTIKADLRVISATNRDLKEMIAAGQFREDLYYRLDVVNIDLPPLKDRGEDLLIIAKAFLKRHSVNIGKKLEGLAQEAITAVQAHPWPGNIRELSNRIKRAVVMSEGAWVTPGDLGLSLHEIVPEPWVDGLGLKEAMAHFESKLLTAALERNEGNVCLAAKTLKTSRSVIYYLMQKYNLNPESKSHNDSIKRRSGNSTFANMAYA